MIPLTKRRLAVLLRDAEAAHSEYEKSLGKKDENWSDWYADYIMKQIEKENEKTME